MLASYGLLPGRRRSRSGGASGGWGGPVTNCHSGLRVVRPQTPYLNPVRSDAQRSVPDHALTIRVRHQPQYVLVVLAGEIDIATVSRLRERLWALAASGRPLVADLDQVSFIDASGLGALAGAARLAAEHGASLHVVCARPQPCRGLPDAGGQPGGGINGIS